jgi:hypothetical protein
MELKNLYHGREIKFYDELMSLRSGLLDDFYRAHPSFKDIQSYSGVMSVKGDMKCEVLRYCPDQMSKVNIPGDTLNEDQTKLKYPTAYHGILLKFPEAMLSGYSVLFPDSVIGRHTDVEYRNNTHIKIHIPLSIPPGDLGFEVAGETADWSDLFAFDTQKLHSAWNNTKEPRIVFIFDLPRSLCGLPDGIPWTWKDGNQLPPFSKTEILRPTADHK